MHGGINNSAKINLRESNGEDSKWMKFTVIAERHSKTAQNDLNDMLSGRDDTTRVGTDRRHIQFEIL